MPAANPYDMTAVMHSLPQTFQVRPAGGASPDALLPEERYNLMSNPTRIRIAEWAEHFQQVPDVEIVSPRDSNGVRRCRASGPAQNEFLEALREGGGDKGLSKVVPRVG